MSTDVQQQLEASTWQAKIQQQMTQFPAWWANLRGRAAPPAGLMAYGAVNAFALWPAVEAVVAAGRGGQPLDQFTLGAAVIGVTGGVGGNLIASHLYEWYQKAQRGEEATAEEVLLWLQANLSHIRPALDSLLEQTNALQPALQTFGETQRAEFAHILRQELTSLGNLARFERVLETHTTTYGASAVHLQNSPVAGNVMGRSNNKIINTDGGAFVGGNVYTGGGDFVGRDKLDVAGDYVGGDKSDGDMYKAGTINVYHGRSNTETDPAIKLAPAPPGLAKKMLTYLSKSEIKTVCFVLDIQYDHLEGDILSDKVNDLIFYCRRKGRVADLVHACAEQNQSLHWG